MKNPHGDEGVRSTTEARAEGEGMADAATRLGLQVVTEFIADRGYHADGTVKMFDWTLGEAGGSAEAIGQRVVRVLRFGTVAAVGGGHRGLPVSGEVGPRSSHRMTFVRDPRA